MCGSTLGASHTLALVRLRKRGGPRGTQLQANSLPHVNHNRRRGLAAGLAGGWDRTSQLCSGATTPTERSKLEGSLTWARLAEMRLVPAS